MRTVSSSEARTRLPELLRSIEQGDAFTITRRGVPIARLVGITHDDPEDVEGVISRMKRARAERSSVSKADIMSARDQGRSS
ncbi:MAG: type II toxin-antitoxin system prevent-host-death family antitoxin [bacterium]|nr:type II toxin-antitoxin system prevent-host-death family antitoxin [bacterium]MDE0242636.1 type II toxin-antitoxin system prevent-host-death family antitoxin [bacterium]